MGGYRGGEPDLLLLLGDNAYMWNSKWDHGYLEKRYT